MHLRFSFSVTWTCGTCGATGTTASNSDGGPALDLPREEPPMNKLYWLAVLERAVKTAAQSAILILIAGQAAEGQVDSLAVDWLTVLSFFLGGFVLSILTSLATSGFGREHPPTPAAFGPETIAPYAGKHARRDDDPNTYRPAI